MSICSFHELLPEVNAPIEPRETRPAQDLQLPFAQLFYPAKAQKVRILPSVILKKITVGSQLICVIEPI